MRIAVSLPAALCTLAALVAAGCGEREGAEGPGDGTELTLMLDWTPNPDHASIYTAQANGHFERVGLAVKIRTPTDPSAPIKQVAAGRVDLAISYAPEVLRQREKGMPVVAVAALVQRPLTSIVALPAAGVRRPADLAGKTVGTAGIEYQAAYLEEILRKAGVGPGSVETKNVSFSLSQALLTKKVDAVLGAFYNVEGSDLRQQGRNPVIIPVDRAGIPPYDELVLVANGDKLEDQGDLIRGFVGALARATTDLRRDERGETEDLLRASRGLDPRLTRASVHETVPTFAPPRGKPFGYLDPAEWNRFTRFMVGSGLLEQAPEGAYTNEWLPGEGL
jgi:putative hydroxymethylpyrimidine transport system substrate-binding protein